MTVIEFPPTVMVPAVALALADLGDCVCSELAATGAGPTCWCGLYPGAQVAWDSCGDCGNSVCGMGWVRLDSTFPSQTFPQPADISVRCAAPLVYRIEVGVLRCMPTMPDGGAATPEMLAGVVLGQAIDAAAIHRAMMCCETVRVAPETWLPRGPQGGCVGGAWTAYLDVREQ